MKGKDQMNKSSAPILPQVLLVAGAAAIGYTPELWPYGKISGVALIVSASASGRQLVRRVCPFARAKCLAVPCLFGYNR